MLNKNLRVVRGNGETVEVNKNLYVILSKLPAPLKKMDLSKDQKFWYNYFGQILIDSKKLTQPDLIHLHSLARSVDYYLQAENEINKRGYTGGLVQIFATGASNVSGHVTLREKMLKEIDNASKHFGFSFKDRMKLNETSEPSQQLTLWEKEMLSKNG